MTTGLFWLLCACMRWVGWMANAASAMSAALEREEAASKRRLAQRLFFMKQCSVAFGADR